MGCDARTYAEINREKLDRVLEDLRGMGLEVPDDTQGKIVHGEIGVEAEFRWSDGAGELWVQISRKPVFIPCGFIYGRIEQAIGV